MHGKQNVAVDTLSRMVSSDQTLIAEESEPDTKNTMDDACFVLETDGNKCDSVWTCACTTCRDATQDDFTDEVVSEEPIYSLDHPNIFTHTMTYTM